MIDQIFDWHDNVLLFELATALGLSTATFFKQEGHGNVNSPELGLGKSMLWPFVLVNVGKMVLYYAQSTRVCWNGRQAGLRSQ